jgi:hypothetical protein
MNGLAMFHAEEALRLANARVAELRREAADNRMFAGQTRRSGLRALVAAISAMPRRLMVSEASQPLTPSLNDYPYRP